MSNVVSTSKQLELIGQEEKFELEFKFSNPGTGM